MGFYPFVAVASASALQPWQFQPETYGAKGDGKVGTGGTGTSGTSAFSDAGAAFTSADKGKLIMINQGTGGGNTLPFTGTILNVVSATAVTLSGNLAANAASAPYIYGTDDVAAINSCLTAAAAYAAANTQKVQVVFGDKFYMLGAITQTTSPAHYNTHIPLPYNAQTAPKLVIDLVGSGVAPAAQYWESSVPSLTGTTLVSAITPPSQPDGTYGQFSLIGGPNALPASSTFFNAAYTVDGITVCAAWGYFGVGFDGFSLSQLAIRTGRALAFAPVNLGSATVGGPWMGTSNNPTADTAVGFRFPTWFNNAFNYVGWAISEGWSVGFDAAEHFSAQFVQSLYADRGFQLTDPTETPCHGLTIQQYSCEACNYGVYVNGDGGAGVYVPFNIGLIDMEQVNTKQFQDADSVLTGMIWWNDLSATRPDLNGGENLIVIDTTKHQPGPWSGAPAAPANNAAQQNLAYRYATIYLSATGGITNTGAGQASTGLTATGLVAAANVVTHIRVGPGSFYSVTYSGTLTTSWVLD